MGLFDSLKNMAVNIVKKEAREAVNDAVKNVGKGKNRSESFSFAALPANLAEMQQLPEAKLDSAFKTTALVMAALCRYPDDPDAAIEMLNWLKGPEDLSTYEKGFIKERLTKMKYIPLSYFKGATPENGYVPSVPYTISVYENPYSFDNDGWATMWVESSGADNKRQIKLRQKKSTNQWFLNDIQCLSEIRIPVAEDVWA